MTAINETSTAPAQSKKRIIALDLMRGYFILVIASIHLAYYPSLLGLFDGRGQLWVSEAEGFFFISGLLIGIIRRKDIGKIGYVHAARKLWQRGRKLYLASIALTFLYLLIAAITRSFGIGGAKDGLDFDASTLNLIWRVLTLNYSYGWADFLAYYAAFMLVAPAVLWLLYKRLWWLVAILSGALWVMRWAHDFGSWNPFLQWQIYFFWGSIIGYYWHELESWVSKRRELTRRIITRGAMLGSAATMAVSSFVVFTPTVYATRDLGPGGLGRVITGLKAASANSLYDTLLLHGRIGLLRPLVAIVVFSGMFAFIVRFEKPILRLFGKVLVPFGQNSLYIYIVQSLALFAIPYFLRPGSFWVNSASEMAIIGLAWVFVSRRWLFRIIPR